MERLYQHRSKQEGSVESSYGRYRWCLLASRHEHSLRAMGNTKSSALSREILEDIKLNTKFSEDELTEWYSSFMRDCPDGRISRERFEKIYARFFPNADPKVYAQHVFRSFDKNSDGTLDFKEYIIALHLTSSGKTQLKLEWAFSLYDVDGNGTINKSEILEIVKVQ